MAVVTIALLPYEEVEYTGTSAVDASSWLGLLSTVLAHITGSLGHDVGDKVTGIHAGRMAERLTSVTAVHGVA